MTSTPRGDIVTFDDQTSHKTRRVNTDGPCILKEDQTLHLFKSTPNRYFLGLFGPATCGLCDRSKIPPEEGGCPVFPGNNPMFNRRK